MGGLAKEMGEMLGKSTTASDGYSHDSHEFQPDTLQHNET
jgi:hypothetical protein